jgi:UDP-2-acetamido-3-amino-2,3-dideoxy-glucuronate N-acetyltransferase
MTPRTVSLKLRSPAPTSRAVPQVAVIGCGYWGKNLIRNFAQLGALRWACDLKPEALRQALRFAQGIQTAERLDPILEDPDTRAVVIATPAPLHYAQAKQALLRGKDVFVEKPLALRPQEGRELVELARSKSAILMVGHILEYHPAVLRLKSLIQKGELGKIQYVYSNRLNLGKIRQEENILWSFAPHDISAMLFLLEETPAHVACHGGSYLHHAVADVTVTGLSFPSGVQGHIFVSWLHPFKEQKLIVVGDRKMAVFDDAAGAESKLVIYSHRITWRNRMPTVRKQAGKPVPVPSVEPLTEECRHFLHCLRTRQEPRTNGMTGVRVLEVLERCQASLGAWEARLTQGQQAATVFIHPSAVVDQPCEIGAGTQIWHYSHVMPHATIGADCRIGQNVMIGRGVRIGNNVKIQNNVSVYEGVSLEDDVFCGPSMVFTNVINPRSAISRRHEFQKTLVRRGATIGANATVLCGRTIGCFAFIGAGAVVTRDVPDFALVVGTPGRIAGWMCQCGVKLPFATGTLKSAERSSCPQCHSAYAKRGTVVELLGRYERNLPDSR